MVRTRRPTGELRIVMRYDEDLDGMRLYIFYEHPDGSHSMVQPLDLTLVTTTHPYDELPEPTIKLDRHHGHQFLQGLVEALVQNGFRPDELKAHDKELEATKYHLEDMRKLVQEALIPPEIQPVIPRR